MWAVGSDLVRDVGEDKKGGGKASAGIAKKETNTRELTENMHSNVYEGRLCVLTESVLTENIPFQRL